MQLLKHADANSSLAMTAYTFALTQVAIACAPIAPD